LIAMPGPAGTKDGQAWRVAAVVVLALAAFRYAHGVLKLALEAPFIDFATFYTFAATMWAGRDPFAEFARLRATLDIPLAGTPPTFTPAGYLLFLPFTALPFGVAKLVWLVLGQGALAVALWVIARRVTPPPAAAFLGLVVVLGYQPIPEDIALGNLNLLVLCLVTLAATAHAAGRSWPAALALSWAISLKPPYLLLVPFLCWLGAPGTAVLALGLAAAWVGLGVLVLGPAWLGGYLRFLTLGSAPLHAWPRNLSPHAMLHRLLGVDGPQPVVEAIAIGVALAVAAGVAWATRRAAGTGDAPLWAWATAVAALPLVSPLTEEAHLVVLLLPLLIVLGRVERLVTPGDLALAGAAAVLLASRYSVESFPAFRWGLPSLAYGGKTLGVAALAVAAARLGRTAEAAGRGRGE
jgi:hypothetical protein